MYKAEVLCDSIGATHGRRLISVLATYPRFIHSELLTHRDRARSSASSRAIPWKRDARDFKTAEEIKAIGGVISSKVTEDGKYNYSIPNCMYSMIVSEPFIPDFIGVERPGMQSGEEIEGQDRQDTIADILAMRNFCLERCNRMAERGVHKSIVNRYVEPWMWISVIYTATEWKNFFRLRCHPAAEKHFQKIAGMMRDAINASTPKLLQPGELHTPFWDNESYSEVSDALVLCKLPRIDHLQYEDEIKYYRKRISAGRSCRISYLTHEGKRDILADIKTASALIERADDVIHAAALEHVATCHTDGEHRSGPFFGWSQFRKEFANENVPG